MIQEKTTESKSQNYGMRMLAYLMWSSRLIYQYII